MSPTKKNNFFSFQTVRPAISSEGLFEQLASSIT